MLDSITIHEIVKQVATVTAGQPQHHGGMITQMAGAFQFIGFAVVYLLLKHWKTILDFVLGRPREHINDYRAPINGERCPEIKEVIKMLPTFQNASETIQTIKTDISAIREHEQHSETLLVTMREDYRKDQEHNESVQDELFVQTRSHDKSLAALEERTKRL